MPKTHKLSGHPLYKRWRGMIDRCYLQSNKMYQYYGGRGIAVHKSWKSNFQNFYDWSLANGWHPDLELDRIKNNIGYRPDNCRWVTHLDNMKNQKRTRKFRIGGKDYTMSELSKKFDINRNTLARRLQLGWSIVDALTAPKNMKHKVWIGKDRSSSRSTPDRPRLSN